MFGDSGLPFAARLRFRLQEPDRGRREAARPERASQCLARLESAVVYLLGVAPLELPVVDLAGAFDGRCPESDAGGRRVTVTVPAGTFAAEELPGADGERLWVARDVPLWGLVRAESRRVRVELVGFGWSGARSVLPAQGTGSDNTNE
jgi:hypothetical protein